MSFGYKKIDSGLFLYFITPFLKRPLLLETGKPLLDNLLYKILTKCSCGSASDGQGAMTV